ncbi:MAG: amidohydrolase family protein [Pseudomonadales bacterium]
MSRHSVATACIALALALLLCSCSAAPPEPTFDLAITNVTLIDAKHGVRRQQTIWVSGEQIAEIQASSGIRHQSTRTIDGTGRFLMPGLWDMHVHVTYEPALTEPMANMFLDYGVTSVRDTGGLLPLLQPVVERWRRADTIAPRIFYSGPLLDGSRVVYNGEGRSEIGIANPNEAIARENIQTLVAAGVDFVKLYELVSPEVFASLVGAARQRGLPIAAHVPLSMTADVAGPEVDSLEHLRNIELACSDRALELHEARQQTLAQLEPASGYALRSQLHAQQRPLALGAVALGSERCRRVIASLGQTIQVPTLRLNTLFTYPMLQQPDWQAQLARLPEPLASEWQAAVSAALARNYPGNVALAEWSMDLVAAMYRANVPIGAGTDTPIGLSIPGYSLHTELARLVDAGLPPLEALRAANMRGPEFFGLSGKMGALEVGMAADLVLLSADPLVDINNTRRIDAVIARGRIVRDSQPLN